MKYGFKCPCHGVQIFETQVQRDAFAITPTKKPAKKPQSNPVNDTIKTVRGAINNTIKTWAPKPKAQRKSGAAE